MKLNLRKLAPAALILAGFLAADQAAAQRRCEMDAAITGRTCSVAECLALQAAVHAPDSCGDRGRGDSARSCENITGCYNLKQMRSRWLQCYITRNRINKRCWNGGDPGHQQQAAQAIQNVYTCNAKIAEPEPEGCADRCPW